MKSKLMLYVRMAVVGGLIGFGGSIAQAQLLPEPAAINALCRKDLHSSVADLTNITNTELGRCHRVRMAGGISAGTDCNDTANAPSATRISRKAAKVSRKAGNSCGGGFRPPASPPGTLGYSFCPTPCDSISISDYADEADCLICVSAAKSEELATTVFGTPPAPPASLAEERCQNVIGVATRRHLANLLRFQRRCQTDKEKGRIDAGTDCKTADSRGRIAASEGRFNRTLDRCTDAALGALNSCGATVAAVKSCALTATQTAANALFDAVYPTP